MSDISDILMSKFPRFIPYLMETYIEYILDIGDVAKGVVKVHENSHEKLKELADGHSLFYFPINGMNDTYDYFVDDEGFVYMYFEDEEDDMPTWTVDIPLEDLTSLMSSEYDLSFGLDHELEPANLSTKLKDKIEKEESVKNRRASMRLVK